MSGIEKKNKEEEITIYPNPTTTIFTIKGNYELPAMIELYDITGRKIIRQPVAGRRQQVDVSSLSKGLYVWQLVSGKEVERGKVVVK